MPNTNKSTSQETKEKVMPNTTKTVTGDKETKELAGRNNNPGNIRVLGSDTEFVKFSSMQEGFDALLRQIELYKTGGSDHTDGSETLAELMAIYAPKADKNDPVAYADTLATSLGVTVDTPIKNLNTNKLALAISKVESPQTYKAIIADKNVQTGVRTGKDGEPLLSAPDKTTIVNSELVTEGRGKGKYKTTFITDQGREESLLTEKPVSTKEVFGDTYLSEEGSNKSYRITDTPGKVITTRVDDRNIAKDKLKKLTEKSNRGEELSSDEVKYLRNSWDIVEMDMIDEEAAAAKGEGWFEDGVERENEDGTGGWKRNAVGIRGRRNQWGNDVLEAEFRLAKSQLVQDKKIKDEQIKLVKEKFAQGELSKDELNKAKGVYDDWNKGYTADTKMVDGFISGRKEEARRAAEKPTWAIDGRTGEAGTRWLGAADATNALKQVRDIESRYTPYATEAERSDAEYEAAHPAGANTGGNRNDASSSTSIVGGKNGGGDGGPVDPSGMLLEDAQTNPDTYKYLDEDYLKEQNTLDQETIDFIKSQKGFQAELPEEEYDYNNLIGNISDVGRGIIGLAGSMEEVPEYQRGDMFQESMDDARWMKDQGLTAQERGSMKQDAERAFGFGVANVRGMSGGSGAAALSGLGQQTAQLQNQYGNIENISQGVKRQNRQAFAQAAVQDEQVNRQIFDDKLGQVTANKREGAALARDAYTNMNERAQFNQQYGKDSQYAKYMNEQILSNKQARHDKIAGDERRNQQSISNLEGNQAKRNSDIKKNQEAIAARKKANQ